MSTPRIASLLPSATEVVCALGLRDSLVGVSHECDFPAGVESLPVLTATRDFGSTSGQIDRGVRELLRDALAVYSVNVDVLEAVAPDLIVTQDLCDVCAVSLSDVERAVATLPSKPKIISLSPTRLADVIESTQVVGAAAGVAERGVEVTVALNERIARIAARVPTGAPRPRVLTIEWLDPVMVGGTWMPELVTLAGGEPLVTEPGQHAPTLTQAELMALDPAPDVVLIKPCGFDLARTCAELAMIDALLRPLPWPAIRDGRVWIADGNAYFNRPGPRLVESLELLAACIRPSELETLDPAVRAGLIPWQG